VSAELHGVVAARLQDAEQRYTAGRRALVGVLVDAARPLTMAEVQAAATDLPQSSIYRNLAVLEQAGVVRRVHGGDASSRYELAEDLTEHHHHLVCQSCGTVEDFTMPPAMERGVDEAITEVGARTGFEVHGHRLDLVGLCARCRRKY
jgi:Fur family ferric uptake transcriptional regulator